MGAAQAVGGWERGEIPPTCAPRYGMIGGWLPPYPQMWWDREGLATSYMCPKCELTGEGLPHMLGVGSPPLVPPLDVGR